MNEYKSKDFLSKQPQADTLLWVSSDKQFTITTTTNAYSQFFVYVNLPSGFDEWIGITADSLDQAIEELNNMIKSEEIQRYLI